MNIFEKILRHFGYVKQDHEVITLQRQIQIQSTNTENDSDVSNNSLLPVPVIAQFSLNSANKITNPNKKGGRYARNKILQPPVGPYGNAQSENSPEADTSARKRTSEKTL